MYRARWIAFVSPLLLGCVVCCGQLEAAQSASPASADGKVYVAFRMRDWKSQHLHDAAQAEKQLETLKNLTCEVKKEAHNGHVDVSFRTVIWKSLALDSHDQAHQWVAWLKQNGFETLHAHPAGEHVTSAGGAHAESVQYRCVEWKAKHVHSEMELKEILAIYRGLGCQFEVSKHNGHNDVKLRCPDWMEIDVVSHEAASVWQKYLQGLGFEAKHEH